MSCNSCAKSFSLLRKEKGCPNCGFSYCSKCLDHKVFVPKLNADAKVCTKCKKSLATSEKPIIEPPDAYYKRLAASDNSSKKGENTETKSPEDEIAERLKKLRQGRTNVATEEEIAKRLKNLKGQIPTTSDTELQLRLARLKGIPDIATHTKPVLPAPDLRTEQEQADDLLRQYMEHANIDSKYKDQFDELINDMETRVQKLKGDKATSATNKPSEESVESEDEEETVKKIIQKIKAEATLEDNEISPPTNDELPFCEICNEDARMRCLGCRYLFCKRCFMEHKDDDDGCDRYEPYQPPKGEYD